MRRYGEGWHPWTTLVREAWISVYDKMVVRGQDRDIARVAADKVLVSHMDGGPYSWHMRALAQGNDLALDDLLADEKSFYGYPFWGDNPYA